LVLDAREFHLSSMRRQVLLAAATVCAQAGFGCAPMKQAQVPLREIRDPYSRSRSSANLLVMMPGAQEEPEDFFTRGYVEQVRKRRLDTDIVALDSHMAYFSQSDIAQRLLSDVIQPAKAQGYQRIWLMGISLGGFGAFIFESTYPNSVNGTIALAPYIGTRAIERQVREAGGLMAWRPLAPVASNDWETPLMLGLQTQARREQLAATQGQLPRLVLGYGSSDRFAPALGLVKDALPAKQTLVVPGGHDWPAWNVLWEQSLDQFGHLLDGSRAST
jgi:pimeloyl-ACP methyl ester carboxylesterase